MMLGSLVDEDEWSSGSNIVLRMQASSGLETAVLKSLQFMTNIVVLSRQKHSTPEKSIFKN